MNRLSRLFAIIMTALLCACGANQGSDGGGGDSTRVAPHRELTVFAAASLREALEELGAMHTARTGDRVTFNFAGSNELARQIVSSRGVDVFVSAAENWMDTVESARRLVAGSRRDLLSNTLVVVANSESDYAMSAPCDLAALGVRHLALADPESVPAGRYARTWLSSVRCNGASLWDALREKVSPSPDVRAALGLVLADPSVAGIVYRTDQLAFPGRTRVLFEVSDGPPIRYAIAQVAEGDAPAQAQAFIALLTSRDARAIFEKHGFTVVDAPTP